MVQVLKAVLCLGKWIIAYTHKHLWFAHCRSGDWAVFYLCFTGAPQALLQSCLTFGAFSFIIEGLNKQQPALALSSSSGSNHHQGVLPPLTLPLPSELKDSFSSFCQSITKRNNKGSSSASPWSNIRFWPSGGIFGVCHRVVLCKIVVIFLFILFFYWVLKDVCLLNNYVMLSFQHSWLTYISRVNLTRASVHVDTNFCWL